MGNESLIGRIARFWSPNNSGSKPDVEGEVIADQGGGRIVVNENGERVTVNMHGGWLRTALVVILLAVGVGGVYAGMYTDYT